MYHDGRGFVPRLAAKKQWRQQKQGNGLGKPQSLCHPDIIAGEAGFS